MVIVSIRAALVLSPSRIRNNLNNREAPRDTSAGRNNSRTAKDDLSRNITSLLETLLKDYDSRHHPGYDSGFSIIIFTTLQKKIR